MADANIIGPLADPDRDGLQNLTEWALGLIATLPTTAPLTIIKSGPTRTFTHQRPTDCSGITYAVEVSPEPHARLIDNYRRVPHPHRSRHHRFVARKHPRHSSADIFPSGFRSEGLDSEPELLQNFFRPFMSPLHRSQRARRECG